MKITTIKLTEETKHRLERLKSHKRDTYEDILINVLEILNTCRANPDKARSELIYLDRKHYRIFKQKGKMKVKEIQKEIRREERKEQRRPIKIN